TLHLSPPVLQPGPQLPDGQTVIPVVRRDITKDRRPPRLQPLFVGDEREAGMGHRPLARRHVQLLDLLQRVRLVRDPHPLPPHALRRPSSDCGPPSPTSRRPPISSQASHGAGAGPEATARPSPAASRGISAKRIAPSRYCSSCSAACARRVSRAAGEMPETAAPPGGRVPSAVSVGTPATRRRPVCSRVSPATRER